MLRPIGIALPDLRHAILAVLWVCSTALPACATTSLDTQPAIAAITGDLHNGGTVTISGSGFGSKTPAKPIYWADFETSLNPTALGQRQTWERINPQTQLSKHITPPNSRQSARWNAGWDAGWPPVSDAAEFVMFGKFEKVYIYAKRNYDYDLRCCGGVNHKIFRFWTLQPSNNNMHTGYHHLRGGDGRTGCEGTATFTHWHEDKLPDHQWLTQEVIYKTGSINGNDGVYRFFQNGKAITDRADHRMRTTQQPNMYEQFGLQDDISNETKVRDDWWIYYDDIYMDNTWARVMIGDAPTLATSRRREIQIPVSWSDTAITIRVNQGALPTIKGPFYLYVVDSQGRVNRRGYPLCPECGK